MNVETVDNLANLIGRYGVTLIGLIVVAWGLYRLIKRVLDKNDEREKELTGKLSTLQYSLDSYMVEGTSIEDDIKDLKKQGKVNEIKEILDAAIFWLITSR